MKEAVEYRKDCPGCGGLTLTKLDDYASAYLCRCNNCQFVFAGKIPSAVELQAHYAHKYANKYDPSAWVSETTRKRLRDLVTDFASRRQTNRLLDVGCGRGLTLEAAASSGWECYGTEYSEEALTFGRQRGFTMHRGELASETYPPGHFDIIVMTEVIEHFAEPFAELRLVTSFLRPGGLLYLTTPNFDSLTRRTLKAQWNVIGYPAHLSYFTLTTLRRMLKPLSLRVLRSQTTGFSPTRFRKSLLGRSHDVNTSRDADEFVRNTLDSRPSLRLAKAGLNQLLSMGRLGDTLKVWAEKA